MRSRPKSGSSATLDDKIHSTFWDKNSRKTAPNIKICKSQNVQTHLLKVWNMTIFDQWKSRLSILIHFLRIRIRSRGENRLPTLYSTGTGIRKKYDPLFCLYNCTRIKCGQVAASGELGGWAPGPLPGYPTAEAGPRDRRGRGPHPRQVPGTPTPAKLIKVLYYTVFLFIQSVNQCCGAGAGGAVIVLLVFSFLLSTVPTSVEYFSITYNLFEGLLKNNLKKSLDVPFCPRQNTKSFLLFS